ncbi:unnamed protein product [Timema podura]|uniref:CRAL-TRIO domain-containing protein n=1 Tax=Timema podura TaxID=61482 RepID=A0ABN7P9D7_TIMPD|nr:unnamed protein product [Timema podura]
MYLLFSTPDRDLDPDLPIISSIIHFHGSNWSLLHKYIGPEILPKEYGGHLSDLDYSRLNDYLYNNEQTLTEYLMGLPK